MQEEELTLEVSRMIHDFQCRAFYGYDAEGCLRSISNQEKFAQILIQKIRGQSPQEAGQSPKLTVLKGKAK